MPIFLVPVKEVWTQFHRVEAADKKAAILKVAKGESKVMENEGAFEYSHTLGPDDWRPIEELEDA